jgi:hypothetical protein
MPTAHGSFRGGLAVADSPDNFTQTVYAAFEDEIYTVLSDGQIKYFGDLPGTDKIFISRNQNASVDVVIVCEAGAYYINSGAISAYPDSDVGTGSSAPVCMTYHDGYFMFGYRDGDILASGLNAVTINTLDVANAASNADGLVQLWSYSGQLYAAGEKTIEVWGYPVNNAGFPLTRVGYHITPGLISPHCVAGFEPEWGNPPIYVGTDNTVRWLQGYQAQRISTPDLERLIAEVEDQSTLEAMAYRSAGTAFWQLSCDDWTWVFNANNPGWFERKSDGSERSRFTGGAVYAFGTWLVGDTETSKLLEIDHTVAYEGVGNNLTATIISPSIKAWPNRVRIARADFDLVVPAVTADTTAPTIDISWSDDGGATFKNPLTRSLGSSTSDTVRRITVLNTGYSHPMGRRWKLECSDQVDFALLGGDMAAEIRAK